MKDLVQRANAVFAGIILGLVYVFGIGISSLLYRVTQVVRRTDKKEGTFWEDAEAGRVKIDHSSPY